MEKMSGTSNPHDRQLLRIRVNQIKNRRNGKILLVALGCTALVTSLTAPFTLAQSSNDSAAVLPGDAEAIEAAVQVLPLPSSTVLDTLSDDIRAEVERTCLPIQYQQGSVAYRECVQELLDSQSSASTVTVPNTSLSFDEEYAIQQSCREEGPVDSAAYRACDEKQLASLAGVPEPALEKISEDETYAVQLGCYEIQTSNGVRAYRECLNESISQLLALPRPNLTGLTLVERNALQLRCSAQNVSAVEYRNCLLDAVGSTTIAKPRVDTFTDAPGVQDDIEPLAELSGQNAALAEIIPPSAIAEPAIAEPAVAATAEESQPTELADSQLQAIATPITQESAEIETAPALESDEDVISDTAQAATQELGIGDAAEDSSATQPDTSPEQSDDTGQTATDLLNRLQTSFANMSDMTRMLIWAAIALPLLLTLTWLMLRGRKSADKYEGSYPEYPVAGVMDLDPHRSSPTRRINADDTAQFSTRHSAQSRRNASSAVITNDDTLEFANQMDELFGITPGVGTGPVTNTEKNLDTAANSSLRTNSTEKSEPAPAPAPAPAPSRILNQIIEPEPAETLKQSHETAPEPAQTLNHAPEPDAEPATTLSQTAKPEAEPATTLSQTAKPEAEPAKTVSQSAGPEPAKTLSRSREPESGSATTPDYLSERKPETAQTLDQALDLTTEPDLILDSSPDSPAETVPTPESPALTDITLTPATERDDYLAWLSVQDEAKQQTLAIEFLIYWMAYSDERYPPELKKNILQLQNPGDHELIKRWTLNNDIHAFAGNLQWVQYNLNSQQHEQIINLLIALLVSENALTPAQNTLLRFLADAFGLGAKRLDELYQAGFAQAMPQLPRLDDPVWWEKQSADTLKRWDARSVSRQRSEIRYRVALGLPLEGELEPDSIIASFRRAARRCQPDRFDRLSTRERNLVAKQLEKYETAAESLLEVSA